MANEDNNHSAVTEAPTLMTLPVRVETVSVGGKLMTRGFYNQIFRGDLIDRTTGELNGTPLGKLNLHDADCPPATAGEHLHIVWVTTTDELRMSTILEKETLRLFAMRERDLTELVTRFVVLLADVVYVNVGAAGLGEYFTSEWDDERQVWVDETLWYRPGGVRAPAATPWIATCPNPNQRAYSEAEIERFERALTDIPKLVAAICDYHEERQAWRLKAKALWMSLSDLPQFFILA